jgi:hypothetical protein
MKSFLTASFVAALALAPSASADTFLTQFVYTDSDCTYLQGIYAVDYTLYGYSSCAAAVISTCTSNGNGGFTMATCGNSLLGEIGYNAYYEYYSDSLCDTPYYVITIACACCTGNELYPCDSFHSALAPFLCFRRLSSRATILARP